MTTTNVQLMSRRMDEESEVHPVARAARSRSEQLKDAVSFALVGVAFVGFAVETLDMITDNVFGVTAVGGAASVGAVSSLVYGRLEHRAERLAKARLVAWNIVRFFVAFELVRYGVAKLVNMQFYTPWHTVDTRVADLSSSALAWAFFGRSYAYQAIGGVLELLGAVLLCSRRTAILGALVVVPVMTNIVLVDLFFGINVRLFSTIYLVMALFVIAPEARRMWLFAIGAAVPARAPLPPSSLGRMTTAFIVGLVLVLPGADIVNKAYQRGLFQHDALEGAWKVERQDGAALTRRAAQWDKLYLEKGSVGSVRMAGRGRLYFKTDIDEQAHTVRLAEATGTEPVSSELSASYLLDGKKLHLEGQNETGPFSLDLVRELPR